MGEGLLRSSWSLEACGPGSFCFRSSRPNVSIHYSRYSLRLRWPQSGHYGRQSSRDPRSSTAVEQRLAARAHRVVRARPEPKPRSITTPRHRTRRRRRAFNTTDRSQERARRLPPSFPNKCNGSLIESLLQQGQKMATDCIASINRRAFPSSDTNASCELGSSPVHRACTRS